MGILMRPKVTLLLAALLTAGLALPSASSAAAPRSFYGVMAAYDPGTKEAAWMGTSGVGTVRINLVWSWVQPNNPEGYDWSHYDQVIGNAARNGIQVLPTIYGSPAWVAARQNYPPSGWSISYFRDFVHAAAQRYGARGTFWAEHPEIPRLPIRWWQFWNEVSSPNFWTARPNAKQYVNLLRVFHSGIKSADPSAKIVLAGLFPMPYAAGGIPYKRYLRSIYKHHGAPYFDAAAIHPYGASPAISVRRVHWMRRIMNSFGDTHTPIWVTEIGWASAGVASTFTVSPEQQADYLQQTFEALTKARKRLDIAGAIWFSFRDQSGPWWLDNAGMFTAWLKPKPAYYAFIGLTGGEPPPAGDPAPSTANETPAPTAATSPLPLSPTDTGGHGNSGH
jgi:polysaccharide biosynthesis protein PslG